ncbi:hypothetical protein VdG1_09483 [Verticillium dahliae VDG1]|nr:hypothetical protein VdG1_09483 [Verticillium dahliae VDG1]
MFPHAEVERVSVQWNFIYALFIPLGVLIAWNFVTRASVHKHEVTYLCFGIALVMTSFITDVVKNAVGRPRPDLVARCKPEPGTPADVLVSISVCLGFLSLFFAGQLHVFRHESGGRDLSRALVCLVPLLGAALIAISRCEDYRHDVYDVGVGSILGYTVAYWSYRRHWPKLTARDCHEPHPYPGTESKAGWSRVRDEEDSAGQRPDVGFEMAYLGSPLEETRR